VIELPPRQRDTLDALQNFIAVHGFPPTVRELAADLCIARSTTVMHLDALAAKRVIRREPATARGLTIPDGTVPHA